MIGDYTYHSLNAIEGVKTLKPEATFYLLADFNSFATDLQKLRIDTSQKLSEALIVHPYHTAIVGGDSLVLERNDYRARIAYVDYNGKETYQNYKNQKPKTPSEKLAFVESNAPKVVAGIKMIKKFFDDIKKGFESTKGERSFFLIMSLLIEICFELVSTFLLIPYTAPNNITNPPMANPI